MELMNKNFNNYYMNIIHMTKNCFFNEHKQMEEIKKSQ